LFTKLIEKNTNYPARKSQVSLDPQDINRVRFSFSSQASADAVGQQSAPCILVCRNSRPRPRGLQLSKVTSTSTERYRDVHANDLVTNKEHSQDHFFLRFDRGQIQQNCGSKAEAHAADYPMPAAPAVAP